jgi:DNA-directed RNA polymerase subunit RPC12/RpoP
MDHAMPGTEKAGVTEMKEGDEFSCPNCGCRIVLRHHGDPEKMPEMRPFTCCCGTTMDQGRRT